VWFLFGSRSLVNGLSLPALPWTFRDAKILYQPALVPLSAAKAVTPKDLSILGAFGWTLGGVFGVEWTDSPVGYYREVAVLSALVYKDFGIGAWASHIVVTEREAAVAAQSLFGLPAVVGEVGLDDTGEKEILTDAKAWTQLFRQTTEESRKFAEELAVALKYTFGTAVPGLSEPAERLRPPSVSSCPTVGRRFVFSSSDSVEIEGWDGWLPDDDDEHLDSRSDDCSSNGFLSLNLPSFSGRLPQDEGRTSALLRYDLRLGPARNIRLRPPMATDVRIKDDPLLENVLGGPVGWIPCLQVDGVTVVAGGLEAIG